MKSAETDHQTLVQFRPTTRNNRVYESTLKIPTWEQCVGDNPRGDTPYLVIGAKCRVSRESWSSVYTLEPNAVRIK